MKQIRAVLISSLVVLALASPAVAFNVPGCPLGGGVFDFIFKDSLLFEPGGKLDVTDVNALVLSPDGLIKFGAFNTWTGIAVANEIRVPHNAEVGTCIANKITGAGAAANGGSACGTESAPGAFDALAAACKPDFSTLFPPIDFDALELAACGGNIQLLEVIGPGVEVLPPGCYLGVKVLAGSTADLQAGNYFIRNLDVGPGGTFRGVGSATNVRIKKPLSTAPGCKLLNFDVILANTVGESNLANGCTITGVKMVSPESGIHVHTGTIGEGVQLAGTKGAIEPSTFSAPPPPPIICECPPGTRFAVPICTPDTTCQQARACVPDLD